METERLAADRDTDAIIAERLMGWVWLERINGNRILKAIFPPDDGRWIRFNFDAQDWRAAYQDTERFSDWDQTCGIRHLNGYDLAQRGLPYYSTDLSAAWSVIEKMQSMGYWFQINSTCDAGLYDVQAMRPSEVEPSVCLIFQPVPLGICRAALRAIGTKEKGDEA